MATGNIAELITPFVSLPLDPRQLGQLSTYLDQLLKWNRRINLTSVRGPEAIIERHFGESLFAAEHLLTFGAGTAIDLGSGAGFPGLPMAIMAPDVRFTLIESQGKKATFLKEMARALDLKNVEVFPKRAQEFGGHADLVTMRAVELFVEVVPIAARMLNARGRLAMLSTGELHAVLGEATHRAGLTIEAVHHLPKSENRALFVARKG